MPMAHRPDRLHQLYLHFRCIKFTTHSCGKNYIERLRLLFRSKRQSQDFASAISTSFDNVPLLDEQAVYYNSDTEIGHGRIESYR